MKTKKKFLTILLVVCLVMAMIPMTVLAADGVKDSDTWDGRVATAFAGGTGAEEDPYQISSGAELAYLASAVNSGESYGDKYFVLTKDIDLNGLSWTPIANSFSDALFGGSDYSMFSGNFDGKGHMISNLTIGTASTPAEGDVFGLFGAADGKISNVNLNHVSINGVAKKVSGYAIGLTGGLAGSASGGIENCHVTDLSINMTTPENGNAAAYWIGGLVGAFDGTQGIKECSVSGNINEASGKGSIGGLIGELGEASEISYSRADVSLDVEANARGGADVGGFIGKGNGNKNEETVIKNCYATGNVTGGSYIGGFAGSLWGLNIKNCYATGNVTQAVASMASFVGTDASAGYGYGSVKNCYSTGSVIGTVAYRYAFAMQDATERSEITNCYFADGNLEVKNAHEAAVAKSLAEMRIEDFVVMLNADDKNNGWTFVEGRTPICGAEPADYSAVDAALESIPSDLTVYTDESVEGLNAATASVVRGRAIASQTKVEEMAKAIEDAIAALEYKDADYSKVDEAIEKANGLNKADYKDFTKVEEAIKAVVRGKNIKEQSEVDEMAKAIEDAIAALEKNPAQAGSKTDQNTKTNPKADSAGTPKTGDHENAGLMLAMLYLSGTVIAGSVVIGKKKKYRA